MPIVFGVGRSVPALHIGGSVAFSGKPSYELKSKLKIKCTARSDRKLSNLVGNGRIPRRRLGSIARARRLSVLSKRLVLYLTDNKHSRSRFVPRGFKFVSEMKRDKLLFKCNFFRIAARDAGTGAWCPFHFDHLIAPALLPTPPRSNHRQTRARPGDHGDWRMDVAMLLYSALALDTFRRLCADRQRDPMRLHTIFISYCLAI